MKKKLLAVGIILLFIGMASIPAFCQNFSCNDTTPPVTTATLDPPEPNDNGWYNTNVQVTLNATDNDSGVNVTYYQIDGGMWQIYRDAFLVSTDGMHNIKYYSIDYAGNIEPLKSVELKIDLTAPTINLTIKLHWIINPDLFIAECNDKTSGMDRVDFYLDGFCHHSDKEEPFEMLLNPWPSSDLFVVKAVAFDKAGNHHDSDTLVLPYNYSAAYGFICNPTFTDHNVSFFALIVNTNFGRVLFKQVTFTFSNNYFGYIGKFFIRAIFI